MTRTIPNLAEKMRARQATGNRLSTLTGICRSTVYKAMRGGAVKSFLAGCIEDALQRYEFKYQKRGRKHAA